MERARGWMSRIDRRKLTFLIALPLSVLALGFAVLISPGMVDAFPSKYATCTTAGCHGGAVAGTLAVAINGTPGTSITVASGGSTSFEIDVRGDNITGSGVGAAFELALPTGWSVALGTGNAPSLVPWNTVWDGNHAQAPVWCGNKTACATAFDTSVEFPNSPLGYVTIYDATGWDTGNRDAAFDDASAGDLDGTANQHGVDATINIPAVADGIYFVEIIGVGHNAGGTKSYVSQVITVTVGSAIAPPAVVSGPTASATEFGGSFVDNPFSITAVFDDQGNAISGCEYTTDGAAWSAGAVSGSGASTQCQTLVAACTDGASLTINMRATNAGGTTAATSIARTCDAAPPATGDNAPAGWVSLDQTITLTPDDGTGSGVASTSYCVDTLNSCIPGTAGTSVPVACAAGSACVQYVRYSSSDNVGNVEPSGSAMVSIDREVPTDGGTFTAAPGDTQVQLNWNAAGDATGSGLDATNTYKVVRALGATAPADCTGATVYQGNLLAFLDSPLTNGQQYSYRVCAYDTVANVSAGMTVSATPVGATPTQTLDAWTDTSTNSAVPVNDLEMARITTSATNGGAALTSANVTVSGAPTPVTALTDIKVRWNSVDDFATASVVGTQVSPVVGTPYAIALAGAGSGSGFLYFTISIPSGEDGNNYNLTVTSVTGATADNISLARTTANRTAGAVVTSYTITSCNDCHSSPPLDSASGERDAVTGAVKGSHQQAGHMNLYSGNDACNACHEPPAPVVYGHRSGTIAMNSTSIYGFPGSYYDKDNSGTHTAADNIFNQANAPVTGVCRNVQCHGSGIPQWGVSSMTCTSCHNDGNDTGLIANAHDGNGLHAVHVAQTDYVNCDSCHGAGASTGAHLNHRDFTPTVTNEVTAWTNPTCTNNCHITAGMDWNAGTIACVDCHSAGYLADTAGSMPTSGLHVITPTISGQTHNQTLTGGCEACHTATPSTAHLDGINNTTSPVINVSPTGGVFADGTPPSCTSTCHSDNAGWSRLWNTTAANSDGTECDNCHGTFDRTGFTGGLVKRHDNSDPGGQIAANHDGTDKCITCHALGDPVYPDTSDLKHRDGKIQINNGATFVDGGATVYCTGCHSNVDNTNDGGHLFEDVTLTRWTLDLINGPAADCASCHASNGVGHVGALENTTTHDLHNANTAYVTACIDCHGHNGPGDPNHFNGTVNFAGQLAGTTEYLKTADFGGTCAASNGCHDSDGTTEWRDGSLGADRCVDCHMSAGSMGFAPTSGLHAITPTISGQTHNQSVTGGCEACHTAAPSTAHIDGTQSTSSPVINVSPTGGVFTDGTPPDCTSTCHADNGAWGRLWNTTAANSDGTECENCHGTFSGMGFRSGVVLRHQNSSGGDPGAQIEANHDGTDLCYTCHTYKAGSTTYYDFAIQHRDGNIDLNNQNAFSDQGAVVGCGLCHSATDGTADGQHQFGDSTARWTRNLQSGPAPTCLTCHNVAQSDAANADLGNDGVRVIDTEFARWSHHVYNVTLTTVHCAICHGEGNSDGSVSTLHKNGQVDLRDTDTTNSYFVWTGTEHTNVDNHCMSCHDTAGATGTGAWAGGTPTSPFNDTMSNQYDMKVRSSVVDVKAQFNTGNASHHAVLGPKYATNRLAPTYLTGTSIDGSAIDDTAQIHCGDCHTSGDNSMGAHGSTNEYMLKTTGATDVLHTVTTFVCYNCHVSGTYSGTGHGPTNGNDLTAFPGAVGDAGRVNSGKGGPVTGIYCSSCHNSGGTGWGGIHGGNNTYTDWAGNTQTTYRFMPGMQNNRYNPGTWSAASGGSCYTEPVAGWGACTQHSSTDMTGTPDAGEPAATRTVTRPLSY